MTDKIEPMSDDKEIDMLHHWASCNQRFSMPPEMLSRLLARLDALRGVVNRLREDVIGYASDAFFEIASKETKGENAGWYCSNARRTALDAGDKLVELGVMEHDPERGYGRVQYYRPVEAAAEAARKEQQDADV